MILNRILRTFFNDGGGVHHHQFLHTKFSYLIKLAICYDVAYYFYMVCFHGCDRATVISILEFAWDWICCMYRTGRCNLSTHICALLLANWAIVFVFSRFTFLLVWEVTPGCVTVQFRWKEHLTFMLVLFYFFVLFLHRFNKILIVFKQLFVLILCCTLILNILSIWRLHNNKHLVFLQRYERSAAYTTLWKTW